MRFVVNSKDSRCTGRSDEEIKRDAESDPPPLKGVVCRVPKLVRRNQVLCVPPPERLGGGRKRRKGVG